MNFWDGGGPKFSENCRDLCFKDFLREIFRDVFKKQKNPFCSWIKKILDPRSHLLPCAVASFVSNCATLHGA